MRTIPWSEIKALRHPAFPENPSNPCHHTIEFDGSITVDRICDKNGRYAPVTLPFGYRFREVQLALRVDLADYHLFSSTTVAAAGLAEWDECNRVAIP